LNGLSVVVSDVCLPVSVTAVGPRWRRWPVRVVLGRRVGAGNLGRLDAGL